jgi:hypothetical protein
MTRKPNHNHVFIRELFPIASSIYSGKQLQTVDDDTWERHYRAIMAEEERPHYGFSTRAAEKSWAVDGGRPDSNKPAKTNEDDEWNRRFKAALAGTTTKEN